MRRLHRQAEALSSARLRHQGIACVGRPAAACVRDDEGATAFGLIGSVDSGIKDNGDVSSADQRRARMQVRVYPSIQAHLRDDAAYWAALPAAERVMQVWRLSEEQWRLRGEFRNESGLVDLLRAFNDHDVRYLIVGAYALGVHGRPRATGDLDVWIDATPGNATRVVRALTEFGAPLVDVSEADFAAPGIVLQMGLPPARIDILTHLTDLAFAEAWPDRVEGTFGPVSVAFIGRDAFIKNKRATGRMKDLGDIESLG